MLIRFNMQFDNLIEEMLCKLPEEAWKSSTVTFCDPCMAGGQFIKWIVKKLRSYGHSDENICGRVFGFDSSRAMVQAMINTSIGTFKVADITSEELKNMKFDVVVGNPPYLKGLHLKFLELGYDILSKDGKLLFVHPSDFLIVLREGKTKDKYDVLKSKIGVHFKSIDFIKASDYFNIGSYLPLSITYIDKSKSENDVIFKNYDGQEIKKDNIMEVNLCDNYELTKSIMIKIKNKKLLSLQDKIKKDPSKKFFVNLSNIVGNGFLSTDDGFTFINRYNLINSAWDKVTTSPGFAKGQAGREIGNEKSWISFDDFEQANRFLKYIKNSLLIKFILINFNHDQNIDSCFKLIPFYNDYSNNDTSLYSFFNFSCEEIEYIYQTCKKAASGIVTCGNKEEFIIKLNSLEVVSVNNSQDN